MDSQYENLQEWLSTPMEIELGIGVGREGLRQALMEMSPDKLDDFKSVYCYTLHLLQEGYAQYVAAQLAVHNSNLDLKPDELQSAIGDNPVH